MLKQQMLVSVVLACFGLFAIAAEPKAVGSAGAASAVPASTAGGPDTDEIRRLNKERLRNAAEQEEKRTAALAEAQRSAAEEKRRIAKVEQEKKAKAEREKRESLCQFKPVMTDEDIANCRQAYR